MSPDVGGVVRARAIAKRLDSDLAIIDKRRPKANVAEVMNIIGDVEGRTCVIMDDIVDTANTLCKAATALKEHGAKKVVAYCTHPVLSGGAVARIAESDLDEIVVTDTIPLSPEAQRVPAHPPALVRAAPRRDDDADLATRNRLARCSPTDGHAHAIAIARIRSTCHAGSSQRQGAS